MRYAWLHITYLLIISTLYKHHKYSSWPRSLMDKASDFESEDCEFESRRGRYFCSTLKLKDSHHTNEVPCILIRGSFLFLSSSSPRYRPSFDTLLHSDSLRQNKPRCPIFIFFRHRQEIESMVAAKDRLWLIKI